MTGHEQASEPAPRHIVIIDAVEEHRACMRALLVFGSERRYSIREIATPTDGLALLLESGTPNTDCVVIHESAHDPEGNELLLKLCDASGFPLCPIVVITAGAPQASRARLLRDGAQDFLEADELTARGLTRAVENAIERYRLQRELRGREAQLRESEERLRLALQASLTGIWTWDIQTDAVTWTPECYALLELAERDFDGTRDSFFRRVHPDDVERVLAAVERAISTQAQFQCEFRVLRQSGETRWVLNVGRGAIPQRVPGTRCKWGRAPHRIHR